MKHLKAWLAAWRERRASRKRYKAYDAGFEYALSVLREETDPDLHRHLQEQAESDPDCPFCFGMRIALNGWSIKAAEVAPTPAEKHGFEPFEYTERS
jgi:hypothetical protein